MCRNSTRRHYSAHFNTLVMVGMGQATTVQFRVPPSGRFDAALVPTGKEVNDRYLLALDDALSVRDQVALYGHAVGHLLLNYQEEQLGF